MTGYNLRVNLTSLFVLITTGHVFMNDKKKKRVNFEKKIEKS
jgi:hypothetical protein